MRALFTFVTLYFIVQPSIKAQEYIYDNNKYDSVLKTGEYFEIIDTIYSDTSMYSYWIKYNFTSFSEGYQVNIISSNRISIQLIEFLSEYFKDTSSVKNDSIAQKMFNYLNEQGIYFKLSSNMFLNSYFLRYGLPCATTTLGLKYSYENMDSQNKQLYSEVKIHCDRYLLVRWKKTTLNVGMHKIRFPVNMKDQLIMVEFPMGIEDNYCNRE